MLFLALKKVSVVQITHPQIPLHNKKSLPAKFAITSYALKEFLFVYHVTGYTYF